jgi:hypothetical protein
MADTMRDGLGRVASQVEAVPRLATISCISTARRQRRFKTCCRATEPRSTTRWAPYQRRASFSDGRLLPVEGGVAVPIAGLSWTETVHRSPHTTVLVLEQLGEHGELESGRMVVDRELFAWGIDSAGNVRPRGSLTGTTPRHPRSSVRR